MLGQCQCLHLWALSHSYIPAVCQPVTPAADSILCHTLPVATLLVHCNHTYAIMAQLAYSRRSTLLLLLLSLLLLCLWRVQEVYAKLPIAETAKAARRQAGVIQVELKQTLKAFIATQPNLASLNDPVILQLLVYTVMGLPLLLLVVVLMALLGGPRGSANAAAKQGKSRKNSGGGKKEAAGKQAGKAAQGRKGAKTVRAGGEVLYTP